MSRNVGRITHELRAEMRRAGAKLSSLDPEQNLEGFGNNNSEGESSPQLQLITGDTSMGREQTQATTNNNDKGPPPAGGDESYTSIALVATLERQTAAIDRQTAALDKANEAMKSLLEPKAKEPVKYGELAAKAAIPTAIGAVGVIVAYAGYTIISNKWGGNAVQRELAASGKAMPVLAS